MLAIGRGLMAKPRLLLLDEPSMGLAPKVTDETFRVINALKETGTTIFLVEQNASAALAVADRGYVLVEGRERLTGSRAELTGNPAIGALFLGGTLPEPAA